MTTVNDTMMSPKMPVSTPVIGIGSVPAPVKPDKAGFFWGTGRRKTSVARVRIRPGAGKFTINGREVNAYFTEHRDRTNIVSPLKATKTDGSLDVFVNVKGGGYTGQAGAVLLGLSRALKGYDPALEPILRENNFLTRDSRKVERKKPGRPGARKRFQFSKR
jgi:small subunit ribosomal protein S9